HPIAQVPAPFAGDLRLSHRKRRSAAASVFRVGVVEDEARLQQCFLVVEREAIQEGVALGIHKDPGPIEFDDLVGGPLFGIEPQQIAVAAATAALQTEPQPLQLVFGERLLDFCNRPGRDLNHGVPRPARSASSYSPQWPRGSPPPPAWCSESWRVGGSTRAEYRHPSAARRLRASCP